MRSLHRPLLSLCAAGLLLASEAYPYQSPLSEEDIREAYFLGQRKDASVVDFLARYAKHLPAPNTGPYVSDFTFSTPFAQLVLYSSKQGQYNAQEAQRDAKTKFTTVDITVYIALTETYGPYVASPPGSRYSTPGLSLRRSDFWRDFKFRVFDGDELIETDSIAGEPQYNCGDDTGCILVGSLVHLNFPADAFTSNSATIEVETPDDQLVGADFDLASLR